MRAVLVTAVTLFGLAVSTATSASPITWHITGAVDTGNQGDFFFPFIVNPGDPIAMDFTFETTAPCSICGDTARTYDNPLTAISVTVGGQPFAMPVGTNSISIANDQPLPGGGFLDAFSLTTFGGPGACCGLTFFANFNWGNSASTAPVPGFDGVELANLLPPDPNVFANPANGFWDISAAQGAGFDVFGGHFLTASASPATVPEPSTLALLASGTMLGVFFRYRRRSRAR
jgi:hypothetical protein